MKTIYAGTDHHGPCKLNISDNLLSLVNKAKATVDKLTKEEAWYPTIEIPIKGYAALFISILPEGVSVCEYRSDEIYSVIDDGVKGLFDIGEVYFSSRFLSKFSHYYESVPIEEVTSIVEASHRPQLFESIIEYYKNSGKKPPDGPSNVPPNYYPKLVEAAKSQNLEALISHINSQREKLIR